MLRAGFNGYFEAFNRGKQSITLDLKSEAGKEVMMELVRSCDCVVENFRCAMVRHRTSSLAAAERAPSAGRARWNGWASAGTFSTPPTPRSSSAPTQASEPRASGRTAPPSTTSARASPAT